MDEVLRQNYIIRLSRNFSKEREEDEKQLQVHEDLIIIESVKTTLGVGGGGGLGI